MLEDSKVCCKHNDVTLMNTNQSLNAKRRFILILLGKVRSLFNTVTGDKGLKGDFQASTRVGELYVRPDSLTGHSSKEQPRPILLEAASLR